MQWSAIQSFVVQSGLAAELSLLAGVALLTLFIFVSPKFGYGLGFWVCIFSLLANFYFSGFTPREGVFAGFQFGPHLPFLKRFLTVSASIGLFSYAEWAQGRKVESRPEIFFLLLLSLFSLQVLVQSESFWLLFFSAEMFTICSFSLARPWSSEPFALKSILTYFGTGALASAIGLFGLSWLQGFDSLAMNENEWINGALDWFPFAGSLMFLSFLLFKLGSVPFHFWVPKVFEEAPTPWVGYISVAPKVAGAFAILHLVQQFQADMAIPLCILIMIGSTLGNLAALQSETLKNMFAFSSIAQAAFLMVPTIMGAKIPNVEQQLLIYSIAYGVVNQGLFCAVQYYENHIQDRLGARHLAGQFLVHPLPALATLILIFSIVGIPPTIGFTAKLLLISTLIPGTGMVSGQLGLFLFGLLFLQTFLSMAYYFKIPYQMIFKNKSLEMVILRPSASTLFWTIACSVFAILAFARPDLFFHFL